MSKKKKKKNKLVEACQKSHRLLGYQFPEASSEDLKKANKPPVTIEHLSIDHKTGKATRIDRPKDQFFRTKSEGRIVGVMPKMKKVKLKQEIWTQKQMECFFKNEQIIMGKEQHGWFIASTKPGRILTAQDQLELLMRESSDEIEYWVNVNHKEKHLVIEKLDGLPI